MPLDRIRSLGRPRQPPLTPRDRAWDVSRRYGVALAVSFLSLAVKLFLRQYFELGAEREAPFMLSQAAVMIAGWYGGLGPGLLATAFGAVVGDYFFMEPFNALGLVTTGQKIRTVLFVVEGALISVLTDQLNAARARAERNEAETRTLQRELLEATDGEQRRIGHDLHDGLGQHLTGIAFMSKLMEQRLGARAVPEADDARKIAGLVNRAIGWTRDLARGLAPVDLDQEDGLTAALKHLSDSTTDLYGPTCRFEAEPDITVSNPHLAVHLYRIAQEALNNAVKHARPRTIVTRLTITAGNALRAAGAAGGAGRPGQADRTITVSVEDDGCGFDPQAVKTGGMGLRIMRYRAKMVMGTLDVRSRTGGGTVVTCTCPLRSLPPPPEESTDVHHEQTDGSATGDRQGQGVAG